MRRVGSLVKRWKSECFLRAIYSHLIPRNRVKHLVIHIRVFRFNVGITLTRTNTGIYTRILCTSIISHHDDERLK